MKEYWVNVYSDCNDDVYKLSKNETKFEAIIRGAEWEDMELDYGDGLGMVIYRLHVREFDTREAKELYLKMKYGKSIGRPIRVILDHKYIASRKYGNWMKQ